MPRATVSTDTERFELKSCPEAFVVLRRMSYGEFMQRQQLAMNMSMKAPGGNNSEEAEASFKMVQDKVAEFEFRSCITDHNLEDENGQLLQFKFPKAVHMLDPRIGQEVSALIDGMNQLQEELGN